MSIFASLFGTAQANQAAAATSTQATVSSVSANQSANTGVESSSARSSEQNPLDKYAKMYDNSVTPEANTNQGRFELAPEAVQQVASKINFTQGMPPELLAGIQAGDPNAFLQALEHVGRQSYINAMQHLPVVTGEYLGQRETQQQGKIKDQVRQELTNNHLQALPNANNPVVKAEMQRLVSMHLRSNPDATPQQAVQAAQEQLMALASALSPSQPAANTKQADPDWDNFFATP